MCNTFDTLFDTPCADGVHGEGVVGEQKRRAKYRTGEDRKDKDTGQQLGIEEMRLWQQFTRVSGTLAYYSSTTTRRMVWCDIHEVQQ